jgi:hypothetical protein
MNTKMWKILNSLKNNDKRIVWKSKFAKILLGLKIKFKIFMIFKTYLIFFNMIIGLLESLILFFDAF